MNNDSITKINVGQETKWVFYPPSPKTKGIKFFIRHRLFDGVPYSAPKNNNNNFDTVTSQSCSFNKMDTNCLKLPILGAMPPRGGAES